MDNFSVIEIKSVRAYISDCTMIVSHLKTRMTVSSLNFQIELGYIILYFSNNPLIGHLFILKKVVMNCKDLALPVFIMDGRKEVLGIFKM